MLNPRCLPRRYAAVSIIIKGAGLIPMREAKKVKLRHAYLGPQSRAQIARANAVSESTLQRLWAKGKAAGILPDVRPHFAEQTTLPVPLAGFVGDDLDNELDDESLTSLVKAQSARLLNALHTHHADASQSTAHCVPAAWLRFDRKGAPTPTHAMLMAMCLAHDAKDSVEALA
ncbi:MULTISPECIES: hypothetical protein [unclassified Bradyrhizobium]|uniref:hypothetical protein n=1 Tax=unclassified Bradyrhizobium TaxID=2631580 RepID=UPI0028E2BE4A|nr:MULTISPECIES: hypothetical protein [unclassified Bradyrhizobium]